MEENAYLHVDGGTLKLIDEKMPPEEELLDLAEFFKVFGDGTRLKILYVLLAAEMCVYDIAMVLGMSQSAISHQLRVLKQMDLVKNRREGKTIFYSLADSAAHINPAPPRPSPPGTLRRCCSPKPSGRWWCRPGIPGSTHTGRSC